MSWIKIELGKLGKTYTGLSGKTKDDFGSGKPYIPYLNVFSNNKINPEQLDYVQIKKGENQNKVQFGDLFFTTSSETIKEVGMTSVLLNDIGEAYLNSFCFGFRLNDFEILLPEFAPYIFRSEKVRHKISMQGQGSTRYNLSKTELLQKLALEIPSKSEQIHIAQILSKADAAIEQTERLIAKYQRIKTGLMQDLLTKGIDEHGNIRLEKTHRFKLSGFRGYNIPEEWENTNFKNITKCKQGLQIPIELRFKESGKGRLLYITVQAINNKFKNPEFIQNAPSGVICGTEDILFTRTGNTGEIISGIAGVFHNNFFRLDFNRKLIVKNYLIYYLQWEPIQNIIRDLAGSTTIPDLNHKDFFTIPIFYPKDKEEQKLIVKRLSIIDSTIEVEQKHLYKLQSLKTGLMQDLLSGRVRIKIKEEKLVNS